MTGFHSVIDRPDSVSRVAPPTSTMANTSAATANSHNRIARRCASAKKTPVELAAIVSFACLERADHIGLVCASQSRHGEDRRDQTVQNAAAKGAIHLTFAKSFAPATSCRS